MKISLSQCCFFSIFVFLIITLPVTSLAFKLKEKPLKIEVCDLSGKDLLSEAMGTTRRDEMKLVSDLDSRLRNCSTLRDNIFWQVYPLHTRRTASKPVLVPYSKWTRSQKLSLARKFQLLLGNRELQLKCPDIYYSTASGRLWTSEANGFANLYYSAEEAFDIFTAHVAHALFLETRQIFPWRLADHPAGEIQEILSSDRYFSLIKPTDDSVTYPLDILSGRDYQARYQDQKRGVGLCDPQEGYVFMEDQALVGETEIETLANIMDWFRANATHNPKEDFRGLPYSIQKRHVFLRDRLTVREWIDVDRDKSDNIHDYRNLLLMYDGCHRAAADFRDLARSVNIPVLSAASQEDPLTYDEVDAGGMGLSLASRSHRGLCWKWESPEGRCVWHTDDFYANMGTGYSNTLPYDVDGLALNETERKLRDFQTLWLLVEDYESWGFVVDIHKVKPGVGFGKNEFSSRGYYNLGYFLGYWLMSDRQAQNVDRLVGLETNPYRADLSRHLRLHQVYQMGTWTNFMEYFACDEPQERAMENIFNSLILPTIKAKRRGFVAPVFFPYNQYYGRGVELVNLMGGCEGVDESHFLWEQIKRPRFY